VDGPVFGSQHEAKRRKEKKQLFGGVRQNRERDEKPGRRGVYRIRRTDGPRRSIPFLVSLFW
jgi:hypothetical protein